MLRVHIVHALHAARMRHISAIVRRSCEEQADLKPADELGSAGKNVLVAKQIAGALAFARHGEQPVYHVLL